MYCATSSPSTKTLSFASISSAMASLRASRTVISLVAPSEAYLLAVIEGVTAAGRKAGRKAGAAGREADSRRAAGRRSLEAAIGAAGCEGEVEGSEGRGREMAGWEGMREVLTVAKSFVPPRSGSGSTGCLGPSSWERLRLLAALAARLSQQQRRQITGA